MPFKPIFISLTTVKGSVGVTALHSRRTAVHPADRDKRDPSERPAVGVNSLPEYAGITTEVNRIVINSSCNHCYAIRTDACTFVVCISIN